MRKFYIILVLAVFSFITPATAQQVQRQGNIFTQVSNQKQQGKETKTQYIYKDNKGNSYPVFLSAQGKAFIKRISQKTGKEYRQYLPEVGKQINPEAYKK